MKVTEKSEFYIVESLDEKSQLNISHIFSGPSVKTKKADLPRGKPCHVNKGKMTGRPESVKSAWLEELIRRGAAMQWSLGHRTPTCWPEEQQGKKSN